MDSRTQISKTSIILTDADKWDDWLGNIRWIALSADIWEHINPNVNEVIPLTKPPFPTYSQVNTAATTFANLNPTEQEEWQWINRLYMEQSDDYKQKLRAMNNLVGWIQDTIDMKGISYLAKLNLQRNSDANSTQCQNLKILKTGYQSSNAYTYNVMNEISLEQDLEL